MPTSIQDMRSAISNSYMAIHQEWSKSRSKD